MCCKATFPRPRRPISCRDGAGARISKKPFLVECVEWVQESRSAFAYVSTQPESFPWDQAQVRKTPAEKNAPPIFFQTCLEAYVLPRTALELTVAIFPLIARWNRFERIPVLGDPTLFNAEEVINASGYATKRSLGDDEDEVTLAKYLVHAFVYDRLTFGRQEPVSPQSAPGLYRPPRGCAECIGFR